MGAGAPEPVVGLVDWTFGPGPVAKGASLIPGRESRRVADAALVNGVAAVRPDGVEPKATRHRIQKS